MKKSALYALGGLIGTAALFTTLGMKSTADDTADLGRYQLISVESHPGGTSGSDGSAYLYRIDSVTGEVWRIYGREEQADKVKF